MPTKGWAHTVAHGADALGRLAEAGVMGRLELTVLLDVIADRLLVPTDYHLVNGEDDRLAMATMRILRRDLVGLDVLEPWVARLAGHARAHGLEDRDPYLVSGNVQRYLRALYLQVALAPNPPANRSGPAARADRAAQAEQPRDARARRRTGRLRARLTHRLTHRLAQRRRRPGVHGGDPGHRGYQRVTCAHERRLLPR